MSSASSSPRPASTRGSSCGDELYGSRLHWRRGGGLFGLTRTVATTPLAWLIGEWQGYGLFPNDTTYIHKEFRYVLGGKFLVEETIDVFPPAQPTVEYQIHQDRLFYYPRDDGFALKGFFVEGIVWNAAVTVDGDTVRIVTEDVEGGPPGIAARVTIVRTGTDRYEATFELGSRERGFRTVETLFMRRVSGG